MNIYQSKNKQNNVDTKFITYLLINLKTYKDENNKENYIYSIDIYYQS